jgi:hypothetical protein
MGRLQRVVQDQEELADLLVQEMGTSQSYRAQQFLLIIVSFCRALNIAMCLLAMKTMIRVML